MEPWHTTQPPAADSTVPEPATLTLFTLYTLTALRRQRR